MKLNLHRKPKSPGAVTSNKINKGNIWRDNSLLFKNASVVLSSLYFVQFYKDGKVFLASWIYLPQVFWLYLLLCFTGKAQQPSL